MEQNDANTGSQILIGKNGMDDGCCLARCHGQERGVSASAICHLDTRLASLIQRKTDSEMRCEFFLLTLHWSGSVPSGARQGGVEAIPDYPEAISRGK